MPKIYEAWPGNNLFMMRGITGNCSTLAATLCVYITAIGIFIAYMAVMAVKVFSLSPVLPILFVCSFIAMIILLNLTSFTDPGFIPRRPFLEENPDKYSKYLRTISII